jgi:hypothetical protein
MRTEHLCATTNLVAAHGALRYTFAVPRPAGFAGLGAHARRNAERQEVATKREFSEPCDDANLGQSPRNRLEKVLNCF